jgi:hypothetical protein
MDRRTFLATGAAGTAATFGIAVGLLSGRTDATAPEAIVETYYRRGGQAENQSDFADSVAAITHPVSDLTTIVRQPMVGESLFTTARDARLTATTVADRDLPADRIVGQFFGASGVTPAEFREQTTETAVIEATINFGGEKGTQQWAVGTDDSAWRLVGF